MMKKKKKSSPEQQKEKKGQTRSWQLLSAMPWPLREM